MEPTEYRRTSLETWQATAPGWERWRAQLAEDLSPVRTWLIRELAPRPGDTVLELSAGPGDTGFAAAAIVGERGRLLSTDFSPEMVEVARRRGAELGLRNVDYGVIDAERIELDADSVDGGALPERLHADGGSGGRPPKRAACCGRAGAWRCRRGMRPTATPGRRPSAGSSSSAATFRRRSRGVTLCAVAN